MQSQTGRFRRLRRLFVVLAALVAGTFAGAVPSNAASVTLGYFLGPISSSVFVAKEEGFFQNRGLDVTLVSAASGPVAMTLLFSGSAQFTDGASALLMFPQVEKGQGVVGLFSQAPGSFVGLVSAKGVAGSHLGQPYPSPLLALKGKKVGVIALGSVTDLILRHMLPDAGLNPDKDVTIIAVGGAATGVAALKQGAIDALISIPGTEQLLDAAGVQYDVLLPPAQFPKLFQHFLNDHIVTTTAYAQANPQTVKNMCLALHDADTWMAKPSNLDKLAQDNMKYVPGFSQAQMTQTLTQNLGAFVTDDGYITQEQIDNSNALLREFALIKTPVSYDSYVYAGCRK